MKMHVLASIANVHASPHPPYFSKPLGTLENTIYDANQYPNKEVGGRGGAYKYIYIYMYTYILANVNLASPQRLYKATEKRTKHKQMKPQKQLTNIKQKPNTLNKSST